MHGFLNVFRARRGCLWHEPGQSGKAAWLLSELDAKWPLNYGLAMTWHNSWRDAAQSIPQARERFCIGFDVLVHRTHDDLRQAGVAIKPDGCKHLRSCPDRWCTIADAAARIFHRRPAVWRGAQSGRSGAHGLWWQSAIAH